MTRPTVNTLVRAGLTGIGGAIVAWRTIAEPPERLERDITPRRGEETAMSPERGSCIQRASDRSPNLEVT